MVGYDVVKNQDYFDRMWKLLVAWNVFMAVELGYDAATINVTLKATGRAWAPTTPTWASGCPSTARA